MEALKRLQVKRKQLISKLRKAILNSESYLVKHKLRLEIKLIDTKLEINDLSKRD